MDTAVLHAEMKPQNPLLAFIERGEQGIHGGNQLLADQLLLGLRGLDILHQHPQRSVLPVPGGHVQRADLGRQLQQLLHLCLRDAGFPGNLPAGGLLSGLLPEGIAYLVDLAHPFGRVHRHPDQAAVVHEAPGHSLPNPFCGIGGEPVVQRIVKFSGRRQQTDGALLNQVHQRHTPSGVLSGDTDHQPQVGIHHLPDGILVPLGTAPCQLPLFLGSQQRISTDFT